MRGKWARYIALGVAVAVVGVLVWQLEFWNWKKLDLDKLTGLRQTSVVYDADGERVGNLYGSENRLYVSLSSIPEHVQEAFIAAEDQRFYQHNGVDPVRILGALWHDIRTMSLAQGASTITQQLIKLTHLTSEKTLSRKAQEIVLALQLERVMSKEEILERYLNAVYFGRGAYGIEAAANVYFDCAAADLTLAQGALLAGIIKSPTNYAPHLQPENARERRDRILEEMARCGFIDEEQARAAAQEEVVIIEEEPSSALAWYIDCRRAGGAADSGHLPRRIARRRL